MFWRAPFVWQVSLLKECDHPNVIRQCDNSRKVCRSVIPQSHEPFEGFMRCCPWTELCTWCLSMWIWPGPQGNSAGNMPNSKSYRRAWNAGPRISAFSWKGRNFSVAPLAEMDSIQRTLPSSTAHRMAVHTGRNGAFKDPLALKNAAWQCIRSGSFLKLLRLVI